MKYTVGVSDRMPVVNGTKRVYTENHLSTVAIHGTLTKVMAYVPDQMIKRMKKVDTAAIT